VIVHDPGSHISGVDVVGAFSELTFQGSDASLALWVRFDGGTGLLPIQRPARTPHYRGGSPQRFHKFSRSLFVFLHYSSTLADLAQLSSAGIRRAIESRFDNEIGRQAHYYLKFALRSDEQTIEANARDSRYSNFAMTAQNLATRDTQPLSPQMREQLILEHLPQVKLIARRIHERLPVSVSLDDLISTGVLGLIAAIDRYDASHDVKLKTYAEYKIRGAILDSLRGLDWAPRQQRKRSKQIEAAIAALEQEHQRTPTEEEIAAYLGLSVSEYQDWLTEIRGLTLGSLENAGTEEDGCDLLRYLADTDEQWPSQIVERAALERLLAEAIEKMPQLERTVLSLYYYEEMTLREIAKIVELHESRISQLKSQAILRLRSYMQKRWPQERS
jgi:RNA polymerase sigma factor for flagellar operon FliA